MTYYAPSNYYVILISYCLLPITTGRWWLKADGSLLKAHCQEKLTRAPMPCFVVVGIYIGFYVSLSQEG